MEYYLPLDDHLVHHMLLERWNTLFTWLCRLTRTENLLRSRSECSIGLRYLDWVFCLTLTDEFAPQAGYSFHEVRMIKRVESLTLRGSRR
jgi:hypothetical protein